MADSGITDAAPVVPEYDQLYGWERRACLKRFTFHFDQGVAAHPERPDVVWDRAVYLGYYGGLQVWAGVMIVSWIPGCVADVILRTEPWRAIPIALSMLPLLLAAVMYYVRLAEARKLHPAWRHHKRDMDATDWDVTLTK
jgi:hypothetical protein